MFDLQNLPVSKGIYALHLHVPHLRQIIIGRLGYYRLPVGDYLYIGSAMGAGGLRARVGHHLHGTDRPHWHIDYVRTVAEVQNVFYTVTDVALECKWGQALTLLPGAFIPVSHFGSSDCRSGCAAHLVAFPHRLDIADIQQVLEQASGAPVVALQSC